MELYKCLLLVASCFLQDMNTRTPTKIVDDEVVNERVPPLGDQVPQGDQVQIVNKDNEAMVVPSNMSNEDVSVDLLTLT